jgi:hypothetical protein
VRQLPSIEEDFLCHYVRETVHLVRKSEAKMRMDESRGLGDARRAESRKGASGAEIGCVAFNYAVGLYSLLGAVEAIEVFDDDDDDEVVVPSKTRNSKRRKVESEEPASAPERLAPRRIARQLASSSHDVRRVFLVIWRI